MLGVVDHHLLLLFAAGVTRASLGFRGPGYCQEPPLLLRTLGQRRAWAVGLYRVVSNPGLLTGISRSVYPWPVKSLDLCHRVVSQYFCRLTTPLLAGRLCPAASVGRPSPVSSNHRFRASQDQLSFIQVVSIRTHGFLQPWFLLWADGGVSLLIGYHFSSSGDQIRGLLAPESLTQVAEEPMAIHRVRSWGRSWRGNYLQSSRSRFRRKTRQVGCKCHPIQVVKPAGNRKGGENVSPQANVSLWPASMVRQPAAPIPRKPRPPLLVLLLPLPPPLLPHPRLLALEQLQLYLLAL